jgi:hypothetical protein
LLRWYKMQTSDPGADKQEAQWAAGTKRQSTAAGLGDLIGREDESDNRQAEEGTWQRRPTSAIIAGAEGLPWLRESTQEHMLTKEQELKEEKDLAAVILARSMKFYLGQHNAQHIFSKISAAIGIFLYTP